MHLETPRVASCMACCNIMPLDDSDSTMAEAEAIAMACANPPSGKTSEMS